MNDIPAPSALADSIVHIERLKLRPGSAAGAKSGPLPSLVRVSSVEAVPIRWLWPGRMAIGKATLLAGHPGLGKSQLTAFLAGCVTTGQPWPAGEGRAPLGNVIMLSAEDDIGDTIRPRLEAVGANIDRVHILKSVRDGDIDRGFNLARDLTALEFALSKIGDVRLVVIDPITAYLGGTDTHKTGDVRAVLAPVAELAAQHGVAIVAVSHLNKSGGNEAMGRITGSLAFVAAARATFLVQKDAEDASRRLFLPIKNNLGVDDTGLAFRIVEREVSPTIRAPAIAWEPGRVTVTADEALAAAAANDGEEGGALREAVEFLRGELAGGPVSHKVISADAKANGISERTLKRAKTKLGVSASKSGMSGGWNWELPSDEGGQVLNELAPFEEGHEKPKGARHQDVAPFEKFGPLRADCRTLADDAASGIEPAPPPEIAAPPVAIPEPYARRFAELEAGCPRDVPRDRWQRCLADARTNGGAKRSDQDGQPVDFSALILKHLWHGTTSWAFFGRCAARPLLISEPSPRVCRAASSFRSDPEWEASCVSSESILTRA